MNRVVIRLLLLLIFVVTLLSSCGDNPPTPDNGGNIPPPNGDSTVKELTLKLFASDKSGDSFFGAAVAMSGDTALVGASRDSEKGDSSGSAYVFRRTSSGWIQEAKLTASDGEQGDRFGFSVVLVDNTAVVGAIGERSDSGAVYVFKRTGSSWTEESKLTASDYRGNNHFGSSVAMDADTLVVGSNGDNDKGELSGSAYVFRYTGSSWVPEGVVA
jgi:hypothetical protein